VRTSDPRARRFIVGVFIVQTAAKVPHGPPAPDPLDAAFRPAGDCPEQGYKNNDGLERESLSLKQTSDVLLSSN
jgi:hypothetical protein